MAFRVALNGYGRIGQSILRALYAMERPRPFQIVAINELADSQTLCYLTRYDTTHGRFPLPVSCREDRLEVDGDQLHLLQQPDPEAIDWERFNLDLVFDCSGAFCDRRTAESHLRRGAGRLLVSHPSIADVDATIVYGYNHQLIQPEMRLISNASCTTNCLVPILDILHRHLGIEYGVTTTIHSAMNDQPVIDCCRQNRSGNPAGQAGLRLARSALQSMVPVETGLARGIDRLMPELAGRFASLHVRVPTTNVSLMDLSLTVATATTATAVNRILASEAEGRLRGLLGYTEEPLASIDFNGDPRSAIVDGSQTRVCGGKLVKLLCWFDNEWGFAHRMLDVASHWLQLGLGESRTAT